MRTATGAYGSKGTGKSGILVVASAVAPAAGVTIHDLPLTPEQMWAAIQERGTHPAANG